MDKTLDLRVQKTHTALLRALYELLCEKSFDKITITELCDRAVIRKATFYKHFGDKNELFSYMIREMQLRAQEEKTVQYDPAHPQSYYTGIFRFFLEFLEQNEQFIRKILSSSARSNLIDLMAEQTILDLKAHFKADAAAANIQAAPEMLAALYTGALIHCGEWWITQNPRPEKELVIAQCTELMQKLF